MVKSLKREQLKKKFKEMRKAYPELKKVSFNQFKKLFVDAEAAQSRENQEVLTPEQEAELADMVVEEVIEDENNITE